MRLVLSWTIGIAVAALGIVATLSEARAGGDQQALFSADSVEVVRVVDAFQNALAGGDSAAALSLLAPDAVILESGGMETRAEYRSHHLPSDIAFARAVKSIRSPLRVTVAGSTAWTVGTSTSRGEFNGRAINSMGAESMVLAKESAGWRIRSIHWSSRNRRPPST